MQLPMKSLGLYLIVSVAHIPLKYYSKNSNLYSSSSLADKLFANEHGRRHIIIVRPLVVSSISRHGVGSNSTMNATIPASAPDSNRNGNHVGLSQSEVSRSCLCPPRQS
jgi:hypothetical protein